MNAFVVANSDARLVAAFRTKINFRFFGEVGNAPASFCYVAQKEVACLIARNKVC